MAHDQRFQDVTVRDFSLGINREVETTMLQPNELRECFNFLPASDGTASTRYGYWKINETQIAVNKSVKALLPAASIYSYDLFAVCDAKVWGVSEYAGTDTVYDLGTGVAGNYALPTATYYRMVQYKKRAYGSAWTGGSTSRTFCVAEYPGTATTFKAWRAGVQLPAVGPILTSGTTGITGTFKYVMTYFYGEDSAHGESNVSATSTITVTNKTVTVTLVGGTGQFASWDAAHDAGVDKIRIYRTAAGGSDFYYLTETTSALTFADATADVDLDSNTVPPEDNYPTPEGLYLCMASSRMHVGVTCESSVVYKQRVRWSLPGYPDIFPAQNYHDFPADLGDVTGVAELNGQVYVFQRGGWSRLTINYGSEYTVETIARVEGPMAGCNIVPCFERGQQTLVFPRLSIGGVLRLDGSVADDVGGPVVDYQHGAQCAFDGDRVRFQGATGDTSELQYDVVRLRQARSGAVTGTWWPQKYNTGSFVPNCYAITVDGVVYMGDPSLGYIYRQGEYTGTGTDGASVLHAGGTVIQATLTSGDLDLGEPTKQRRLVKIMVEAELDGAATFTWTTDFGIAPGQTGTFALDEGATATAVKLTSFNIPGHVDFRRLRYSITTSAAVATSFTLHSVTFRIGAQRPE